ncbi:uncharacterized protein LOC130761520 [Actinidia eriantha]|uniref:uncharacterized protein LOC130761520 n=1 Tax=Actinidia eriantha TaxID=165200 RepID=UPI002584FA75|nr:uncharacterized protein LOC130761520 [Actinidia eriantha]
MQQAKYSPKKKPEGFIYPSFSAIRSKPSSKWIHVVPAIVFLCIFILWWFSYPVMTKSSKFKTVMLPLSIPSCQYLMLSSSWRLPLQIEVKVFFIWSIMIMASYSYGEIFAHSNLLFSLNLVTFSSH